MALIPRMQWQRIVPQPENAQRIQLPPVYSQPLEKMEKLAREMMFAQQGPAPSPYPQQIGNYLERIVRGDVAKEGINRLNDLGTRMAQGDPQAALDMAMEFGGMAGITKGANIADALKAKHGLSKLSLSERPESISLNMIEVPLGARKAGVGSRAMKDIIDYADSTGKQLRLTPETPDGGGVPAEVLKRFYKKFGFVENKGKNRDFEIIESMYRDPTIK
jgi:GNAT superfamily N-acetyltransferase